MARGKARVKRCREPEVGKCLKCTRPECDCIYEVKPTISELKALLCAGMIEPQAISLHYINKGRRFSKKDGAKA